jgi:SanA protein
MTRAWKKTFFKNVLLIGVSVMGAFFLFSVIEVQTEYRFNIQEIDRVAGKQVALVLGASLFQKQPGIALQDRLDTARALYAQKKIRKFLLSGDNRSVEYNEPMAMKRYLLDKGVPEKDIVLDFAGRRTYDSCYRAKEIFGLSSLIIVTQKYHLPRALYNCNKLGIDAFGVSADRRSYSSFFRWEIRELFASFQAWTDIHMFGIQPVLGEKEPIVFE